MRSGLWGWRSTRRLQGARRKGASRNSKLNFVEEPGVKRKVWLPAMVLGHSRYLWGQYVLHQAVLCCHMEALKHYGGVPRESWTTA